jgi:hypothetical protein
VTERKPDRAADAKLRRGASWIMFASLRPHPQTSASLATSILALCLVQAGCTMAPPDSSGGPSNTPGDPFINNACFRCTLRACNIPLTACGHEPGCSTWFDCVAACPTDATGVSAEGKCLLNCGLPVSAEVLFGCIQDFSTGALLGCEVACAPPLRR